ncbi:MAG: thioredoxin family protein [Chlamydiae bacterium]|nr:thioredoxin family protein [Chlamydiota bacterium]
MRAVIVVVSLFLLRGTDLASVEKQIFITKVFSKAKEVAQAYQKPMVLFFTGSDWCQYSQELLKKTLDSSAFAQCVEKDLIFVWIDFPELQGNLDLAKLQERLFLKEKFHVKEFPTLVLIDTQLQEVTRLGYSSMASTEYGKCLTSAWKKYRDLQEMLASKREWTFEGLQMGYKEAVELGAEGLVQEIKTLGLSKDKGCFFQLENYRLAQGEAKKEIRRQILAWQGERKADVLLQLALLDYQEMAEDSACAALTRLLKDVEMVENTKGGVPDKEPMWRLYRWLAQILATQQQEDMAMTYVKKALFLAPERYQRELDQLMQQISWQQALGQEIAKASKM